MSKTAGWAALLIFQVAVTLALLEGLSRLFDPLGISYYPETAKYLDTMIHEEPIGYRNRPGLDGTFYNVPVRINSLGMRDREVYAKSTNEFRVLVVGDSFPFGIGVPYEESLPKQMEILLNKNSSSERHYRTLNMGVPSYNTEQELIQIEEIGLSLDPDLVILLFSKNDIERKKWVFEKRSTWYANASQRSYAISLLFVLFRQLRSAVGHPEDLISIGEYRAESPRWRAIERSLESINKHCVERRIPFAVITSFKELGVEFRMVSGVGERAGFPVKNLSPTDDSRWQQDDPIKYANSRVDSHPNSAGNRVLATLYWEYLDSSGLLSGPSTGGSTDGLERVSADHPLGPGKN